MNSFCTSVKGHYTKTETGGVCYTILQLNSCMTYENANFYCDQLRDSGTGFIFNEQQVHLHINDTFRNVRF